MARGNTHYITGLVGSVIFFVGHTIAAELEVRFRYQDIRFDVLYQGQTVLENAGITVVGAAPGSPWLGNQGEVRVERFSDRSIRMQARLGRSRKEALFVSGSVRSQEGKLFFAYDVAGAGLDLASVSAIRFLGMRPVSGEASPAHWFLLGANGRSGAFPEQGQGQTFGFEGQAGQPAWVNKGGQGLLLQPDWKGFSEFVCYDDRTWGGNHFVFSLSARTAALQTGQPLHLEFTLQPLDRPTAQKLSARSGGASIASAVTVRGEGEPRLRVTLTALRSVPPDLALSWAAKDPWGSPAGNGQKQVNLVSGVATGVLDEPLGPSAYGQYEIKLVLKEPSGGVLFSTTQLVQDLTRPEKGRVTVSLSGAWEYREETSESSPIPQEGWQPVQIPKRFPMDGPHRYWFRKNVPVPAFLRGRRIRFQFDAVGYAARVFLNGKYVGSHFGGFTPFEVDGTWAALFGETNQLVLAVQDWTAACALPPVTPEARVVEAVTYPRAFLAPVGAGAWIPSTGIWQEVRLVALPPGHVADAFIKTSVAQKTLAVEVLVRNEDARANRFRLVCTILDKGKVARQLGPSEVSLPAGQTRHVALGAVWEKARLWSPDDPYLYTLRVELADEHTRTVDRWETRFGFREVATRGRQVLLNDIPFYPAATSVWYGLYQNKEELRSLYARFKKAHVMLFRFHVQPAEQWVYDLADEMGVLVSVESAVWCAGGNMAYGDPRMWENWRRHLVELVRSARNHPSVLWYSLENELPLWSPTPQDPDMVANAVTLARAVQEVDPTRPLLYEGSGDPGGAADVVSLHYPHEVGSDRAGPGMLFPRQATLYPEEAYWLGPQIRAGQVVTDLGRFPTRKPLFLGEYQSVTANDLWINGFFFGDAGYGMPYQEGWLEHLRQEVPALRRYRVGGCPWIPTQPQQDQGAAQFQTLKDVFAPVTFFLRERTARFYGGDTALRTATVCNDRLRREPAELRLRWRATLREAVLASGSRRVRLAPGTSQDVPITVRLPVVRRREQVALKIELLEQGRTLAEREVAYHVYPRPGSVLGLTEPVGLFDRQGSGLALLRSLGLPCRGVKVADVASFRGRVLVVGPEAFTADMARELLAWVEAGGTAVVLRQRSYPEGSLPVKIEVDARHDATMCFPAAAGHPLLEGLGPEDLKWWPDDHLVARANLRRPTRGNCRTIIQTGGLIADSARPLAGMEWSPLLEVRHGRGRYLLCQIDLPEKVSRSPVARVLAENLFRYAAHAARETLKPGGLLSVSGELRQTLEYVGAETVPLDGELSRAALGPLAYLLVDGKAPALQEVGRCADRIREYLTGGGVLWVHRLESLAVPELERLAGVRLSLEPIPDPLGHGVTLLNEPDPVVQGLSNSDLFWRVPQPWLHAAPLADVLCHAAGRPGIKELLKPAALVKIPCGQGFILLDQVKWEVGDLYLDQASRILSTLITNLGGRLSDPSVASSRPGEASLPLDIRRQCDMGFRGEVDDDGQGGRTEG